jgi:hypothetical protein
MQFDQTETRSSAFWIQPSLCSTSASISASAARTNRLQIKAGNDNETIRITKAVTLVTDRGTVALGRP